MGIDAQIESECGEVLLSLRDPRGYLDWLLSVCSLEGTNCLRFIDPYGKSTFNGLQLPLLKGELETAAQEVHERSMVDAKRNYLDRAGGWPPEATRQAREYVESLATRDVQAYAVELISLVAKAIGS